MTEWKEYKLGEIASFVTEKVSVQDVKLEDYISTENMLPDKGGITIASNKPQEGSATKYFADTILISNIRPYFKKIWYTDKVGGCSNDVLCFKAKDELVFSKYLYFLLSQDTFFDYVMLGSKGCKMPRGDKSHIMNWEISIPPLPTQHRIASILSSLDDKIDLLHRENATLEQMAETMFKECVFNKDNEGTIDQIISIQNGYAFKSKDFKETGEHKVIKIKNISGSIVDIDATDYVDGSVVMDVSAKFKINSGDVLIAMTGAEIGKLGIIPQNDKNIWLNQRVGLLSEKFKGSKYLAYLQLKSDYGQDYIENTATGSAQPNISGSGIEKCGFPILKQEDIIRISNQVGEIYDKIVFNLGQINLLKDTRDFLLPKLMNNEIKIL